METVIVFALALFFFFIFILTLKNKPDGTAHETPAEKAGRIGEETAAKAIKAALNEGDRYFRNVVVDCDGRENEIDNVIVNGCGVFVIEVKSYSGYLAGSENDRTWSKMTVSGAGNPHFKEAINPIRQAEGHAGALAKYLRSSGFSVWVEGYAIIVGAESPVKSGRILKSAKEIDRAIHTPTKKKLNRREADDVSKTIAPAARFVDS